MPMMYYFLIKKELKTIKDVPEKMRDEVEALLKKDDV